VPEPQQRRKQRHLIDFDNPRPVQTKAASEKSLTQVQRWVASALAFVTVEHLAGGIAVSAIFTDERHVGARIGLNVMAAITGILAVVLARAIHLKPALSPWLLVGLLPGLIGAYFTFR
jgi:branched-subunit amino acid transport protein